MGLRRIILSVAACLALIGCAPAAVATVAPATASPTVVPTERPTAAPRPTLTFDDQEIAKIIKTTASEITGRMDTSASQSESDIVQVWRALRDWADHQQTRVAIFTPSDCTAPAVATFRESMSALSDLATEFLDWMAGGSVGTPGGDARSVGKLIAKSVGQINAAC